MDHLTTPLPHPLLFLIGYRGTGKSATARFLAERLGWAWIDADEAIEARQGKSIERIFAEDGEAAFRRVESELFGEFCLLREHVIATGGGVVLNKSNRDRMLAAGLAIWLTADARIIHDRLEADSATRQRRPILTIGGLAEIEQLLLVREPFYRECANLMIDTIDKSPEKVADGIMRYLSGERRGVSPP